MDIAYDHIQEEALSPFSPDRKATTTVAESVEPPTNSDTTATNIDTELRTAVKSFQSSQWGSTLGGWFNTARKQGEDFYIGLQQEAAEAQEEAKKSLMSLREQVVNRTRSLSLEFAGEGDDSGATPAASAQDPEQRVAAPDNASNAAAAAEAEAYQGDTSLDGLSSSDIVREAGTLVASLRLTAASKLKDLQRAEDAADEALLKFGANVRNFLKDAVTISAPDDATLGAEREVLFETQEAGTGKKVVHASRLEALLHAIHTNLSSFTQDPTGDHWNTWTNTFNIDSKTADIASDLKKHADLRRAMEKLVPESVDYRTFWMRYYFLRQAVEDDERRRKEVLKAGATSTQEEEVAWDEESDDETSSTPNPTAPGAVNAAASVSTTTLNASSTETSATPQVTVSTVSPRRSHEDEKRSIPDSDTSYDIVSGATSRAPGSEAGDGRKGDESDDDWE